MRVEHLPSKHEALGSVPITEYKRIYGKKCFWVIEPRAVCMLSVHSDTELPHILSMVKYFKSLSASFYSTCQLINSNFSEITSVNREL
jgi:hypothetical protein